MRNGNGIDGRRVKGAGRVALLAIVGWLCAGLMASVAAQTPARESLDHFPQGTIEVNAQDGTQQFHIWFADTAARSEQGLMYVQSLAHDWGMLFPRNNPGPMAMWMKNTLIPLDMLFLDAEGNVVYIRRSATPQSEAIIKVPAPVSTPIAAVLELAGGECDRRHIGQGDRVRVLASN
jgi:uncharacterized protein